MDLKALIASALADRGVLHWGVCGFGDTLPLLDCRQKRHLPENARSVIVAMFPYRSREWGARNVCRYAVADDYHRLVGAILEGLADALRAACPGAGLAAFVDNSPVREVEAARLCGLGVRGAHNLLITPEYGSWVHLGTVVTDLALPPAGSPSAGHCLGCGACAAACPTGALGPEGFQRERCRSKISQKKGALTPWEAEQLRAGGLAWGCDLCQEVCPLNGDKHLSPIPEFGRNPLPILTREGLAEALRTKAYGYRGRGVLERNLELIGHTDNP